MRLTILAVDDEPDALAAMRELLRDEFDVVGASSAAEALLHIASSHPDVLIFDVMMPGVTGLELCAYLRERPDTRNLPIIICSAYESHYTDRGLYDRWLVKPVEFDELMLAIRSLVPSTP